MKVFIAASNLKPKHIQEMKEKYPKIEFIFNKEDALDAEVIFAMPSYLNKDNLREFVSVRWIQLTTAGFDTADINYVRERKINLTNARDVYSIAIAEDVITKILVLNRNVKKYAANMESAKWEPNFSEPEIYGSTVGIVGTGSIAIEVAKRIQAFGTRTLGYRRTKKYENFFPLHFIMGTVYIENDPTLAKFYFEETLKAVENYGDLPKSYKYEIKQNLDSLIKYIEEPAEKPEEKALSSKKGKRKGVSRKKASNEDDEIKWL